MPDASRLLEFYTPPGDGFLLDSLAATTYRVDFEFLEEDLLPIALGVRSPVSRMRAFRSELERRLQDAEVTILYDSAGCERLARLSPRIDAIPLTRRKLHAKATILSWSRIGVDGGIERRLRLIVGSANLTRAGFRENYECVVALDFGDRNGAPRRLLAEALTLFDELASEVPAPQLLQQIRRFRSFQEGIPEGTARTDAPFRFVGAADAVASLEEAWSQLSPEAPRRITIVSPFWPEGASAAKPIADLVSRLGLPQELSLVCRGRPAPVGEQWLPEFDADVARDLRRRLPCRLSLHAALPAYGAAESGVDVDDETEDGEIVADRGRIPAAIVRDLHAKMLVLEGPAGTALYAGSSNCTRRGLQLGGPVNREAGFVYGLRGDRETAKRLIAFAGPPVEVEPETLPSTVPPEIDEPIPAPTFIAEITAVGTVVAIRWSNASPLPESFEIVMPDPFAHESRTVWALVRRRSGDPPPGDLQIDLAECRREDEAGGPAASPAEHVVPHVLVKVRWDRHEATFPVRFDDKASLPLVLLGRRATEGELIDYFLLGHEPELGETPGEASPDEAEPVESPVDTRRILSYFVRRFVQAIPGVEAELDRAAYSPRALESALRGPTSPLELAERAFASLDAPPAPDGPRKTPTAVGFQLVEIVAALQRRREELIDADLRRCYDAPLARCVELLERLEAERSELRGAGFQLYRRTMLEATS